MKFCRKCGRSEASMTPKRECCIPESMYDEQSMGAPPDSNSVEAVQFARAMQWLINTAHANARNKGFWDEQRNAGEGVALLHSEASELLEALRNGNPPSTKIPGFSLAEEEAADLIIRVGDMKGFFPEGQWRIGEAVIAKVAYNAGRPHKHGKKF